MVVGAAPAYAVDVDSAAALNQAILDGESPIVITGDITMDADLPEIGYDVEIVGNGHTIDLDGYGGFVVVGTANVSALTVLDARGTAFTVDVLGRSASFTDVNVYGAGSNAIDVELKSGGSLTVTGGSLTDLGASGITLDDDGGNTTVIITDVVVERAFTAVRVEDHFGASTVVIDRLHASDVTRGVAAQLDALARLDVVDSTIVAGDHNSGGDGSGVDLTLHADATVEISGTVVIGDPDGDRFDYGLHANLDDRTGLVVSDSVFTGSEVNVLLYAEDEVSTSLVRTTIEDARYEGVYLAEYAGAFFMDESTVRDNGLIAGYPGFAGVLYGGPDSAVISRSTFSGNGWGAIRIELEGTGTSMTVIDSTASGNHGSDMGAPSVIAVRGRAAAAFSLLNSTVTANHGVTSGLKVYNAEATVWNTILSGNTLDPEGGDLVVDYLAEVSVAWSIVGSVVVSEDGTYSEGDGVKRTAEPGVGPLQDNGGPTLTHALLAGSVALDSGDPDTTGAPATDQRGEARIQGGRIDIGSVEMAHVLPATGAQPGPWVAIAGLLVVLGAGLVAMRRFVLH